MKFPTEKELKKLRREFPAGCRIVLDSMDDPQAPGAGTQGGCRGVDEAGDLPARWGGGGPHHRSLGAHQWHRWPPAGVIHHTPYWLGRSRHRGARCPRCGAYEEAGNRLLALSRRADITVCEDCGMMEGIEDAGLSERLPLAEWWVVKKEWRGSFPQ